MARSSTTFRARSEAMKGNSIALKHGAGTKSSNHIPGYQTAMVKAHLPDAVAEVNEALAAALPYLEPPDALLVEQLARLTVRIRLVDNYYDRLGGSMVDSRGRPRGSWHLYLSLLREFRATAAALGVGPASRAALLGEVAVARRQVTTENAQAALRAAHAADLAADEEAAKAPQNGHGPTEAS